MKTSVSFRIISGVCVFLWIAIGSVIMINSLLLQQEPWYYFALIFSLFFGFPAWFVFYIGVVLDKRYTRKMAYSGAVESLTQQLQIAMQELEYEKELVYSGSAVREADKETKRAAQEAEVQAAARINEQTMHQNARGNPPSPPSEAITISCPGCGANKVLLPMQSEECDYCGSKLMNR